MSKKQKSKSKIKFTDFGRNLLINGMNEARNMLLAETLPTNMVTISLGLVIRTCVSLCHSENTDYFCYM